MSKVDELIAAKANEIADAYKGLDCECALQMASYMQSAEYIDANIAELESGLIGVDEMFSDLNVYQQSALRSMTRCTIERLIAAWKTIKGAM